MGIDRYVVSGSFSLVLTEFDFTRPLISLNHDGSDSRITTNTRLCLLLLPIAPMPSVTMVKASLVVGFDSSICLWIYAMRLAPC